MKFGKWLFLLGLSALFVIVSGAVLAEGNSAVSNAGGTQIQQSPTPNPNWPHDGNGNWNGNGNGNWNGNGNGNGNGNWNGNGNGNGNGNWNGNGDGQHHRHHWYPPTSYVAPLTCSLATQLQGQKQAEVAQTFSSLRAAIGSTDVLAVMPSGAIMTIVSGPECSGGTYWYQVTYNGQTGWVTEGGDGVYWLEPVPSSTATVTAG